MSAVRPNFLINVNLERLILLRNDQKTFVQTQGLPATSDLACAPCFQQHSISHFFGTPCRSILCASVCGLWGPATHLPPVRWLSYLDADDLHVFCNLSLCKSCTCVQLRQNSLSRTWCAINLVGSAERSTTFCTLKGFTIILLERSTHCIVQLKDLLVGYILYYTRD